MSLITRLLSLILFCLAHHTAAGGEIRVAVAANFSDAIQAIVTRFEAQTGHRVILVSGSTGKHYAQIKNGAPFEAFFAADEARPMRLEREGLAVRGSRFTYAQGCLLLWSPRQNFVDAEGRVLEARTWRHLAIANPRLAPYGMAAREVLEALGLWHAVQRRLVIGENIGQAWQFVQTGNAELGFVARSLVQRPGMPVGGSYWEIPQTLYHPVEQQVLLLTQDPIAQAFLEFVRGEEARAIIRAYGYHTP